MATPKLPPPSADRPEQVGVRLGIHPAEHAVRGHDVGAEQVVDRHAVRARPGSRCRRRASAARPTAAAVPVVVDRPVRVSPRAPAAVPAGRDRSSPGSRPCSAGSR